MTRIVVVGEGMIELRRSTNIAEWHQGYGGDTLNMAIHLARFGEDVCYFTALGDDSFSEQLRSDWTREGIDPQLMLTAPNAAPGLYAVHVDAVGERTFAYWRSESAARRMFILPGTADALARAEDADLLVFSLISLGILPPDGRAALIALAERMKGAGKSVAFDSNYRHRLWSNVAEARDWRDRAISSCTIGLPTLEDEQMMGDATNAGEAVARWLAYGAHEVVVKLGAEGCMLTDSTVIPPTARLLPCDTSGAGDAFNAGYLYALCTGATPRSAAVTGHRLAGWVVMRPGAIPAPDEDAPYVLQ